MHIKLNENLLMITVLSVNVYNLIAVKLLSLSDLHKFYFLCILISLNYALITLLNTAYVVMQ